jgi:broad specificity phosphatase PhoE
VRRKNVAHQNNGQPRRAVFIARHGNRIDFIDKNWRATAARPHDPHLSPDGVVQAKQLARRLKGENIGHLFASPFLRTVQTAAEVAEVLDIPIKIEHGATEWLCENFYAIEPDYHPVEVMARQYPRVARDYAPRVRTQYPEDAECKAMFERCAAAIRQLVQEFDGNLLFIGHGASVQGLAYGLLDERPQINCGLCSLTKLVFDGTRWTLQFAGDTSHLDGTEKELRFN